MHRLSCSKLCVFVLASFAVFACFLSGCGKMDGTELLRWQDPKTQTTFKVGSRQRGDNMQCYLEVQGAKYSSQILADRTDLHRVSMLRYDEWILVLSGPYVLGGYNYQSGKISGMNAPELPFTVHTLSGQEVAATQIDEGTDSPPFNFQERRDR